MKDVQIMDSSADAYGQERGSVRLAFATREGCEQALAKGLYAWGERCRVSRYRRRISQE